MNLDDWDNTYNPIFLWIMFVACTILNMIVMFNLLIAIISESFGKINSNSILTSNQERARIIAENSFLITDRVKKEVSDSSRYVMVAREVNEDILFKDPVS